jgi:hypothetical protein
VRDHAAGDVRHQRKVPGRGLRRVPHDRSVRAGGLRQRVHAISGRVLRRERRRLSGTRRHSLRRLHLRSGHRDLSQQVRQ